MYIEIKIAVTPAVKKYIAHRHDINPFIVSRSNLYGVFLHHCLVRYKIKHPPKDVPVTEITPAPVKKIKKILDEKIYTEKLKLGLSEDLYHRKGWHVPDAKQYDFNRLVELLLEQDFYTWVDMNTQVLGLKQIEAFYDFRELLHLTEDDLTLKTMEKRYERYRNQLIA